jgi:hypothetical protein
MDRFLQDLVELPYRDLKAFADRVDTILGDGEADAAEALVRAAEELRHERAQKPAGKTFRSWPEPAGV